MKKLLLFTLAIGGLTLSSFASGNYKINDSNVDQMFAQSTDISLTANSSGDMLNAVNTASASELTANLASGDQSKGGYLLRAFFCGWIAMHRSYMGGTGLWWKYLLGVICFPLSINVGVDFWWVVFSSTALDKYKNNNKWFVWMGK